MSSDLLALVVNAFREEEQPFRDAGDKGLKDLAKQIPHPDDPMMGIFIENLVDKGTFVNVDDRDWNLFSLNPSCDAKFSMLHERTWVIHHIDADVMDCFFAIDNYNITNQIQPFPRQRDLPDLCSCAMNVTEEDNGDWEELEDLAPGQDHWYPRKRFNPELEFVDADEVLEPDNLMASLESVSEKVDRRDDEEWARRAEEAKKKAAQNNSTSSGESDSKKRGNILVADDEEESEGAGEMAEDGGEGQCAGSCDMKSAKDGGNEDL